MGPSWATPPACALARVCVERERRRQAQCAASSTALSLILPLCRIHRWNFTPSPGWTTEEAATLKLCLMHLGVGRWKEIQVEKREGRETGRAPAAGARSNDPTPLINQSNPSVSLSLSFFTQESGLLPGKMVQQLNGQTQRLLGQQSLAAYTGLKV